MTTLTIKAHVGIGDLLNMKAMLDNAVKLRRYTKIQICADKGIIRDFRNDSESFKIFLGKLMTLLFSDQHYQIIDNNGPSISHVELDAHYKLPIVKPSLRHLIPKGKDLDVGKYIVVTTKIRHVARKDYDKFKVRYVEALNKVSSKYKIVLMGEKLISNNAENAHYGPNEIYSIYEDLKAITNILDLTVPESTSFDYDSFMQDCYIMSKANNTVTIGEGGNFAIATAFSNILGYRTKNALGHTFLERMFTQQRAGQDFVATNVDNFINELNSLAR